MDPSNSPKSQMKVVEFLKKACQEVSMEHCVSKNFAWSSSELALLRHVSWQNHLCLQQLMSLDIRMLLCTPLTLNKEPDFSLENGFLQGQQRIGTQNMQAWRAICKSTKRKEKKFFYRGEDKLGGLLTVPPAVLQGQLTGHESFSSWPPYLTLNEVSVYEFFFIIP